VCKRSHVIRLTAVSDKGLALRPQAQLRFHASSLGRLAALNHHPPGYNKFVRKVQYDVVHEWKALIEERTGAAKANVPSPNKKKKGI
jgi:hypothetical protein